jgi:hypothetical protein
LKRMYASSWSRSTFGRSWLKTDLNFDSRNCLRPQAPNESYATVCSKAMTAVIPTTSMIMRLKSGKGGPAFNRINVVNSVL